MKDLPTWSDLNKGVRKMTDKEFEYCEEMEKRKHDEKVRELEAQIEKMKCCNNCKYRCYMDWKSKCCFDMTEIRDIENPVTCKCKKWEIKD